MSVMNYLDNKSIIYCLFVYLELNKADLFISVQLDLVQLSYGWEV